MTAGVSQRQVGLDGDQENRVSPGVAFSVDANGRRVDALIHRDLINRHSRVAQERAVQALLKQGLPADLVYRSMKNGTREDPVK